MVTPKGLLSKDQQKTCDKNLSPKALLEDAIDELEFKESLLEWWIKELIEALGDRDWDRAQYLSQQCKEELPELMQDCAI